MELLQWNRVQEYKYCKLKGHCFGVNFVIRNDNRRAECGLHNSQDATPQISLSNLHKFVITSGPADANKAPLTLKQIALIVSE